jgi:hypothetical protein
MAKWEILVVRRDTTIADPPPLFRATIRDLDNHAAGVLPTVIHGPETDLRHQLAQRGISEDEINAAFANPPNC